MAINAGEAWLVALRYRTYRVTVLGPWTLPRWWRCSDLLDGKEVFVRDDWFVERDVFKQHTRR
jgi:hypothetical protein